MTADHYQGELLLKALPGRLMELQAPFAYAEASDRVWTVPSGAVVDGASIPRVFWSLVGGPWDGDYRDASVIHDWYCAVRVQPWKDVHQMFYKAMLRSGVAPAKARILFLAVYYAGPSWSDLTIANMRLLTQNGTVRPPSAPPKSQAGFAFDKQVQFDEDGAVDETIRAAYSDTTKLRDTLEQLADAANSADMSLADMTALVEDQGRAEEKAAALQGAGS